MLALVVLTLLSFTSRPMHVSEDDAEPLDTRLLVLSLALYVPFLVAADIGHASWAVAVLLATFALVRPQVVLDLDWGLLLVFVLMFVDLRLLAQLPGVRGAMAGLGLDQATHLYWASIGASQVISNVPAAIALAEYSRDWRVIAYGVNVGGFGLMVGSLANLIALRMVGDARAGRTFHAYAVPALVVAAVLGYGLLFL